MKRTLPLVFLAAALPASAANTKIDTHVVKADRFTGKGRTVAEDLSLPTAESEQSPLNGIAAAVNPSDFTEVFVLQDQLALSLPAGTRELSANPEIDSTMRMHDALRQNQPATPQRRMRPASLPRSAEQVHFDGEADRAPIDPRVEPQREPPEGFIDIVGRARHEGIRKEYGVGKGVKVDERVLEQDGHALLVQDIEGWWPSEFFMTRVFFLRKDAQDRVVVAVKTDDQGQLTEGKPEDFEAELRWWRSRLKTAPKTK